MSEFGPSTSGDRVARLCRTWGVRLAGALIGCAYTFGSVFLIIWIAP